MILHYVLGQAGSGKSTFISAMFPKEENILFNVGEVLRGTFYCMKSKQSEKNVWSFANPLVYSMFKHCCKVSRDYDVPLVTDGMPRNSKQLMVAHRYLTDFSHKMNVEVNVHFLYIDEKEQISRITGRNGSVGEYQMERIKQSRSDLEGNITTIGILKESMDKHEVKYNLKWYDQDDGNFILQRTL
jgi:adenylate kinase family enzyme